MKRNGRLLILFLLCVGLLASSVTSVSYANQMRSTEYLPPIENLSPQLPDPPAPNTGGANLGAISQVSPQPTLIADDNTTKQTLPPQEVRLLPPPANIGSSGVQIPSPLPEAVPPNSNFVTGAQLPTSQISSAIDVTASSESAKFPATGDEISVVDDPYWWHAGDYAQGIRTLDLNSVSAVRYLLVINTNALTGPGQVDFDLSINGSVVGSFSVLPGETSKLVSFSFPPISAPNYTIRLEETNTVEPGAGSIEILLDDSILVFYDSATSIFPATGDALNVMSDPFWWNTGDNAEAERTIGLNSVYGVRYDLIIGDNVLNDTGHVDLDFSINSIVVGSFSIFPGEMTKSVIFFFPPISGPTYTIRLEETNTVDPGKGSVSILPDTSTISFYSRTSSWFPATGDEVNVGASPYWYQLGDYAQGSRTPGLNNVTGIKLELIIDDNALNSSGHIDLDLTINGIPVGSFSILPGQNSREVSFFFPPISGPHFVVRLEETNTVEVGYGSAAILLDSSAITFYDSTHSTYLPANGDIVDVQSAPFWWNVGDYAEGTRITNFQSITGIHYELILSKNVLNTTGHVDLDLSINGIVVGSISVFPGEMSKSGTMTFSPINGPIYVFRLEETNTVDPGAGSIVIPMDRSPIQLITSVFLPIILK